MNAVFSSLFFIHRRVFQLADREGENDKEEEDEGEEEEEKEDDWPLEPAELVNEGVDIVREGRAG